MNKLKKMIVSFVLIALVSTLLTPAIGSQGFALENEKTLVPARIESSENIGGGSCLSNSMGIMAADSGVSYLGNQKLLVILMDFNDIGIVYESSWNSKIFGPVSSLKNYYSEVTKSKMNILPASETYGTVNDGIVRVRLNQNHPNDGSEFQERDPWGPSPSNTAAQNAISLASSFVNFAQYDTNSNGTIEASELHIMTVFAGYDASYSSEVTPNIWPHATTGVGGLTVQGKSFSSFTVIAERQKNPSESTHHMSTIGVICHEFGHDVGLPDLYVKDPGDEEKLINIGAFSLMANGSWNTVTGQLGATPAHLDPYCKVKLGIVTPTVISPQSGAYYTVNAFNSSSYNILKVNTNNPNEYFLIENRQYIGYDAGIKNSKRNGTGGILVWLVSEENGLRLKLLRAEEFDEPYYAGVNYLGVSHPTELSSSTTPDSTKLFDGSYPWFRMVCMTAASGGMTIYITPTSTYVPVSGISLNKTSTSIMVSGREKLISTVNPSNATNKLVRWSSSNTNVATVDDYGNVTGVSPGTAVITATTDEGAKTATCTVSVNYVDLSITSIASTPSTIYEGSTVSFSVIVRNTSTVPLDSRYLLGVDLYIAGQYFDRFQATGIAIEPGGMKVITFSKKWQPQLSGSYKVQAFVNTYPYSLFPESNTSNNSLSSWFTVYES